MSGDNNKNEIEKTTSLKYTHRISPYNRQLYF